MPVVTRRREIRTKCIGGRFSEEISRLFNFWAAKLSHEAYKDHMYIICRRSTLPTARATKALSLAVRKAGKNNLHGPCELQLGFGRSLARSAENRVDIDCQTSRPIVLGGATFLGPPVSQESVARAAHRRNAPVARASDRSKGPNVLRLSEHRRDEKGQTIRCCCLPQIAEPEGRMSRLNPIWAGQKPKLGVRATSVVSCIFERWFL